MTTARALQAPLVANAAAARALDPTRTTVLRARYAAELARRFRRVQQLVSKVIGEQDALGLDRRDDPLASSGPLGAGSLAGRTDAESLQNVERWLRETLDEEVLEVEEREGGLVIAHAAWQLAWVRRAYAAGLRHAKRQLKKAGLSDLDSPESSLMRRSPHSDGIDTLGARQFAELQGIVEGVIQKFLRALAENLGKVSKSRLVRLLRQAIAQGIERSGLLALTETIGAHAEATLNRFSEMGIKQVTGWTEFAFTTAGDARVCPICRALEGKIFSIDEARGVIPVHPRCRCTWSLVVRVEPRRTFKNPFAASRARLRPALRVLADVLRRG